MALRQYIANNIPNLKFQNYLSASELFLQQRNFEDCRIYALKAIEIDPNQIAPSQILFIANILLLATTTNKGPNHYFILNLPLYTHNQELIKNNFMYASNLLNPNYNPYPFASEALGYALTSWSVLSSSTQKANFDDELKNKEKEKNTFEPNPESLWSPFVGTTKINENNVEFGIGGGNTNDKNDANEVIEISDDEEEDENGKKDQSLRVEEKFVETNGGEVDKEEGNFKKRRIKMMGKSLNKVLGKGNKVDMNKIVYHVEGNDNFECDNAGENTNIEFEIMKDNNVELEIVEGKTHENGNVGETSDNNNFENKCMEDDDDMEFLREDIYDQMKKFYDIEFF
uniref:Dnajc14 protein n=1 Tax=Solanum tuberosum TaxID=4113 RepID=M1BBN4_SOLTU